MTHARSPDPHALGWVLLGGGALMVLFWTLYLGGFVDLGQHDPVIAAFESAFILADTLLGVLLFLAGWQLLRRRPSGPFLMVVAAAMSVYLGLLDFAFYAGVGLYSSITSAAAFELALNVMCVGGGAWCLRVGWRMWRNSHQAARRGPQVFPWPGTSERDRWLGGAA